METSQVSGESNLLEIFQNPLERIQVETTKCLITSRENEELTVKNLFALLYMLVIRRPARELLQPALLAQSHQ